jgi:hypothetical protein
MNNEDLFEAFRPTRIISKRSVLSPDSLTEKYSNMIILFLCIIIVLKSRNHIIGVTKNISSIPTLCGKITINQLPLRGLFLLLSAPFTQVLGIPSFTCKTETVTRMYWEEKLWKIRYEGLQKPIHLLWKTKMIEHIRFNKRIYDIGVSEAEYREKMIG